MWTCVHISIYIYAAISQNITIIICPIAIAYDATDYIYICIAP